MALLFYDEFSNADNADINGSVPSDSGASWNKVYNTGYYLQDQAGGSARPSGNSGASNGFMYQAEISGGTWSNDQDAEMEFSSNLSNSYRMSLMLRRTNDSNFILVTFGASTVISNIRNSGTSTITTLYTGTFQANDVVKASIAGTTLKVYQNSTEIYSGTHTVPASGTPGLGCGLSPGWGSPGSTQYVSTSNQVMKWFKAYGTLVTASVPVGFGLSGGLNGSLGGRL